VARRVVGRHGARLSAQTRVLGSLLLIVSGCGSFNPVAERRFVRLDGDRASYARLGIPGAHWVAYDDQHSRTAACTNRVAGNHPASECSHLDRPYFDWQGGKCPPDPGQLDQVNQTLAHVTDSICTQGVLSALVPCNNAPEQCRNSQQNSFDFDTSNMWGAGVGLSFSEDGKRAWNPDEQGVKGIAFDLLVFPEGTQLGGSELNLRVQIPSVLVEPDDTSVEYDQPLLREDGSLVDMNGNLRSCEVEGISARGVRRSLDAGGSETDVITSEQHPYGSSFWQSPVRDGDERDWGPSPVALGHNEFSLDEVAHPPGDKTYVFDRSKILGVHFQVAHPKLGNRTAYPFAFCIQNLAFLLQ